MNPITDQYIAIDTNVFYHLLCPEKNKGRHINKLLRVFRRDEIALLVDMGGMISSEYSYHYKKYLNESIRGSEAYLIKYWFYVAPKKTVVRNKNDCLAQKIKRVIPEEGKGEETDRAFVYVALQENSPLISNDTIHIVSRWRQLKDKTKPNFRLLTSSKAAAKIPE